MAYTAKLEDELLECFDELGNKAHPRYRSEVCTDGTRKWHGVSDTWVVNRDGMILCTQRSPASRNNPNKWQTNEGGHVKAGVSFVETAVTELYEELSIKTKAENLFLIEKGKHDDKMHFFEFYVYLYDGGLKELRFSDGEIIEAKWYAFDMYIKDKEKYPKKWCGDLSNDNYLKITQWLKNQS